MSKVDIKKIIRLRRYKRLTQVQIARKMEMGRCTYISREQHGDFTIPELNKLASILNTSTEELIQTDSKLESLAQKVNGQEAMLRTLLSAVSELLADRQGSCPNEMEERLLTLVHR